jgi:hypothetical protein
MPDPSLYSLLLAAAAASQTPGGPIEQFDRWERRLRARVEQLHVVPADRAQTSPCDVIVEFAVDNGTPRAAAIRQSSCGRYHERRAVGLVRALGRIGAVPSAAGRAHQVLLKLSYGAQPDSAADRRLADALQVERDANAGRNRAIVAALAGPPPAGGWKGGER